MEEIAAGRREEGWGMFNHIRIQGRCGFKDGSKGEAAWDLGEDAATVRAARIQRRTAGNTLLERTLRDALLVVGFV
jgi:hypothetical protein